MPLPFRVITYNIRKGKGANGRTAVEMRRIGAALAQHEADLILCQEVFHCARTGDSQSGGLAQEMGLSSYYGANKFRSVGHHGNTTFTRLSVEHFDNHDISTNRVERRGALYVRLTLGEQSLHVFNVHLGLNQWQRRTQMRQIGELVERVSQSGEPVLLAGDFNDWRRDLEGLVLHELGFDDPFAGHAPERLRTWHARRPVFSLDRIYVKHLQAESGGRLDGSPWSELSDHLPLMAHLSPT
ncbi:MAG: endonuclease/exonuclease/phosphatase family protein [Myxococcales bacterium]|nr:endonuclease/exonuclease/phosphatase family protein [Myxococcales bacterium]